MMNKCFRTIVVALISIIMIGCDKNEYTDTNLGEAKLL